MKVWKVKFPEGIAEFNVTANNLQSAASKAEDIWQQEIEDSEPGKGDDGTVFDWKYYVKEKMDKATSVELLLETRELLREHK